MDAHCSFDSVIGENAHLSVSNGFLFEGALEVGLTNRLAGLNSRLLQSDFGLGFSDARLKASVENEHFVSGGSSDALFKAVVGDASRYSYSGLIRIRKNAFKSSAFLGCHSLLASPKASADLFPGLEIQCSDVQASHAASSGPLDENALFYLSSRGIGLNESRWLLWESFLESAVMRLPDSIQAEGRSALESKFLAVFSKSGDGF